MARYITGTRFGGHMSFSVGRPMTDDDIHRVAPSVFAVEKHSSRSERYGYIPTTDILKGMRAQGFAVVSAIQGRTRVTGKAQFTKHMLRFQHVDHGLKYHALGGMAPEAVLVNSHDGTSSYHLMSGIFRSICTNSMIVMEDGATDVKVPHRANAIADVIEGSFEVIGEGSKRVEAATAWADVRLGKEEQMILADAAHLLRFGDAEGETHTPIKAGQLLFPRRYEDKGDSLWLTHNVIQENCVRGGLTGVQHYNGERPVRRVTMKAINGIDGDVKLNRGLWLLSHRMAELLQRNAA